MLQRIFTLLLVGILYFPVFVQAFGSYNLQHALHTATEKYAEQSGHDTHHDQADFAVTVKTEQTAGQVTDFIILPLLSENHEYSRTVINRVKAAAAGGGSDNDCDDNGDSSNDSDNHSTAVLTDYAYGRAFSPPLAVPDSSFFQSYFSQRDLFLQTQRLRI